MVHFWPRYPIKDSMSPRRRLVLGGSTIAVVPRMDAGLWLHGHSLQTSPTSISSHLNVRSVMLAAKSEHSDNLIQRWVEPRSSCRAYAHLPDITTSTSFQRISGMLKSTNFASQEQTSDCYSKPVVQIESQALSVNLPMLYRDIEFWKKIIGIPISLTQYTWEEFHNPNAAQGQGLRRTSSKWVLKSWPKPRQCTIPPYTFRLWFLTISPAN